MTANERSDEELYSLASEGDTEALSELRSRYSPILYDFALRVSLDPAIAATATRAAFDGLATAERPHGLPISTWVIARVRDDVLERMRNRDRGNGGEEAAGPMSPVDPAFSALPEGSSADSELAGWAWQAARAQRPRDYSLLDLSVRRGLPADEIAEATDMSHSGIFAILGRLRGFFEEGFAATLLYYRGREACPDMAAIAQSHGALGPAVRREIARHVEGCAACRRTRRSYPSPADLLASFVSVETPESLTASAIAPTEAVEEETGAEEAPAAGTLQGALPLAGAAAAGLAAAPVETADAAPETLEEPQVTEAEPQEPAGEEDAAALVSEAEMPLPSEETAAVEAEEPELAAPVDEAETIAFSPEVSEEAAVEDEEEFEEAAAGFEDEEAEDVVEGELVGASALPVVASSVAVDAAQDGPVPNQRIQFARDRFLSGMGGGIPPRRPWDRAREWFSDQDPTRLALIALFVGALVLAVYLGLALGDSIEGGNGAKSAGGLAALPTSTPGIRQIVCGSGPSTIEQGSKVRLDFDKTTLAGYQVKADLAIQPISPNASGQSVTAVAAPPLSIEVEARAIPGTTARTDEYRILVTFTKAGERDIRSECTILVRVPAAPTTPSAPAGSPTTTASATPTPRPAATSAPPTAAPPSSTPIPDSPTPAPTSAATNTATRTPTITPTRTPAPP